MQAVNNMKHDFPNKIYFLDVDGVINIPPYDCFNKECLNNVWLVHKNTGCKFVISSSWREGDLELTKKHFPEWMREHIIGETIRGYHETIKGSSLPICRGNEIKHWIDRHLRYPWDADPSVDKLYQILDENDKFVKMVSNELNVDYTYVIVDDDQDMLYTQKDNFVNTNGVLGFTKNDAIKAVEILNKIK